jgi:hypothetical protein
MISTARDSLALKHLARDYGTERPGLFERSGLHEMRHVAVVWCREHPVEAAELPSWNVELLAKVLEGVR